MIDGVISEINMFMVEQGFIALVLISLSGYLLVETVFQETPMERAIFAMLSIVVLALATTKHPLGMGVVVTLGGMVFWIIIPAFIRVFRGLGRGSGD